MDTEDEGAEVIAVALGSGETADDKFLLRDDLDFEPLAAAAGFVSAAGMLGNDALEAILAGGFEERFTGAGKASEMRTEGPGDSTRWSSSRRFSSGTPRRS